MSTKEQQDFRNCICAAKLEHKLLSQSGIPTSSGRLRQKHPVSKISDELTRKFGERFPERQEQKRFRLSLEGFDSQASMRLGSA